jgi:hypothetical protein
MNNLSDFILVKNIFSSDFCSNAIEMLNNDTQWHTHRWYDKRKDKYSELERGNFQVTYNTDVQALMYSSVVGVLRDYTDYVHTKLPLEKVIDESSTAKKIAIVKQTCHVRFNRYDQGHGIRTHIDHIHSLFDGKHKGIPAVSLVGVFNDDYEGGEFFFWDDYVVELKAGDVVLFPSVFLYQHGVKPVTKGSRYSWVVWAY